MLHWGIMVAVIILGACINRGSLVRKADFFFFKDFIYLFQRKRERKYEGERATTSKGRTEGEGEADSPLSREPNVELDPRTPGS